MYSTCVLLFGYLGFPLAKRMGQIPRAGDPVSSRLQSCFQVFDSDSSLASSSVHGMSGDVPPFGRVTSATSVTLQPGVDDTLEPMSVPRHGLEYTSGQLYFFDMQSHTHMHYQVQMSENLCPLPEQHAPVWDSTFCCFLASSSC